ncbi:MAG: DMT family transporter [Chloroflexi bacterium]|nr:DMT family transporter [Chloroflexota bacterium]
MRENILLIVATILWGIWGITNKFAIERAHPFTVQWMYSLPIALAIPLWLWLGDRAEPSNGQPLPALGWAVASGVVATLAVLLMFFALQNTPPSLATAITAAYPVVTLALSVLLRLEALSLQKVLGLALVIVGLIVLLGETS